MFCLRAQEKREKGEKKGGGGDGGGGLESEGREGVWVFFQHSPRVQEV